MRRKSPESIVYGPMRVGRAAQRLPASRFDPSQSSRTNRSGGRVPVLSGLTGFCKSQGRHARIDAASDRHQPSQPCVRRPGLELGSPCQTESDCSLLRELSTRLESATQPRRFRRTVPNGGRLGYA